LRGLEKWNSPLTQNRNEVLVSDFLPMAAEEKMFSRFTVMQISAFYVLYYDWHG
jgi:hypothetical protein